MNDQPMQKETLCKSHAKLKCQEKTRRGLDYTEKYGMYIRSHSKGKDLIERFYVNNWYFSHPVFHHFLYQDVIICALIQELTG